MKKHILSFGVATAALFLAGCYPDESVWWSPDGQTAAVRAPDGLRLADASGRLSAVVLPGTIQSAAWLSDGSAVVVSRAFAVTNWAAAEKLIPAEEAAATMVLARAIPDLLKAAVTASGGSLDKIEEKFLLPLGVTDIQAVEPAFFCALSLHRQQILAAISGFTNAAELEKELVASETNGCPIFEITMLSMKDRRPAGEPRALVRSVRPLLNPVLSPRHPILAFRTGQGKLKAMTFDGRTSTIVADENVVTAAWSADGRALIHIVMAESDKVGEIRSCNVVGSGGVLETAGSTETLAMAALAAKPPPRLAVLPDGRVLFASAPITLPARPKSIQPAAHFFLLDPSKPDLAPVPVPVTEGSLPDELSSFALSRDGRHVAVVESGTDAVAVLELTTGKVQIISTSHPGWKSRLIPAWKNDSELTFAALPSPNAARPELHRWQGNGRKSILSKDWPDDIVKAWLEAPR